MCQIKILLLKEALPLIDVKPSENVVWKPVKMGLHDVSAHSTC